MAWQHLGTLAGKVLQRGFALARANYEELDDWAASGMSRAAARKEVEANEAPTSSQPAGGANRLGKECERDHVSAPTSMSLAISAA